MSTVRASFVYIFVEKLVLDVFVDILRCFSSTFLSTSKICAKNDDLSEKRGIVALNVALSVRPEGNKSLIKSLPGVPHAQPLSYLS